MAPDQALSWSQEVTLAIKKALIVSVVLVSSLSLSQGVTQPGRSDSIDVSALGEHEVQPCVDWDVQLSNLEIYSDLLADFEGDGLSPYVPSQLSGPTIARGLDLGTAGKTRVREILSRVLEPKRVEIAVTASGLRGQAAQRWVNKHKDFRISRCEQRKIAAVQYAMYLKDIESVVPSFKHAPAEVRTSVLSFAMHTGNIGPIRDLVESKSWDDLANKIEVFHDNWPGPESAAFQRRRRIEANLIGLRNYRGKEVVYD
jgi:hypothetical protein